MEERNKQCETDPVSGNNSCSQGRDRPVALQPRQVGQYILVGVVVLVCVGGGGGEGVRKEQAM